MKAHKLSLAVLGAVLLLLFPASPLMAIPSPLDHVHTDVTVHWTDPGAPALPWTNDVANVNIHNHLTGDPFLAGGFWDIYGAWDNRTFNSNGHGMILAGNEVRYTFDAVSPAAAKTVVETGFNNWMGAALLDFAAFADPWDRLGMGFTRVNSGPAEITVDWITNLPGAYGLFNPVTHHLQFESSPTIWLDTWDARYEIRLGDAGASGTRLTLPTPWSYDGTPAFTATDLDYRFWDGAAWGAWQEAPPAGLTQLRWNFGFIPSADAVNIYEMDFATIALHEIGHALGLDHTGIASDTIMRDDIALKAHFGSTMGIDDASALAAAINYTYAIPEPGTLALLGVGLFGLGLTGRTIRRKRANRTVASD